MDDVYHGPENPQPRAENPMAIGTADVQTLNRPLLVYRCLECGHQGTLAGSPAPSACPDCGAPAREFEFPGED
ncbi:MAG TPA: hypothetical protein VHH36_04205 [Candidatus Thermoplasmatota archaeon]|nr:hypothetical protein [Candidatus Thermoplasmatota archaeon]